jgi:hypothetical protein
MTTHFEWLSSYKLIDSQLMNAMTVGQLLHPFLAGGQEHLYLHMYIAWQFNNEFLCIISTTTDCFYLNTLKPEVI